MSNKNTFEIFKELNKENNIICTKSELNDFLMVGLLFKTDNRYVTRDNKTIKVSLIKEKSYDFDIDFNSFIAAACAETSKKVYFISERCYNKYKQEGLIITQGNKEYYRLFDKELWLVHIIN